MNHKETKKYKGPDSTLYSLFLCVSNPKIKVVQIILKLLHPLNFLFTCFLDADGVATAGSAQLGQF